MKKVLYLLLLTGFCGFSQQKQECPCCTETNNQFDFWLGEWEVTNPSGKVVGSNRIEKIEANCALKENWTAANGNYTGTSYNFYNKQTGHWEQLWLDNGGGSLHLIGNKKENQMVLKSAEFKNKEGKTTYHQITWTDNEDGTVRQLWETFVEGKEVQIAFDGLYTKKDQ